MLLFQRFRRLLCLAALAAAPCTALAADAAAWQQAIVQRDAQAIGRMVAEGAEVNAAARDGMTALMVAAARRDHRLLADLLARGARVSATNNRGGTALMYAVTAGNGEGTSALLQAGAGVNAKASNGWTALTLAAALGHERIAADLLAHGADPNLVDVYGWTALMRAVEQEREAVVRLLLADQRTALDSRDENGMTALHHARVRGFDTLARMLLERGADATVRDREGRTAAMLGEQARQAGPRARPR